MGYEVASGRIPLPGWERNNWLYKHVIWFRIITDNACVFLRRMFIMDGDRAVLQRAVDAYHMRDLFRFPPFTARTEQSLRAAHIWSVRQSRTLSSKRRTAAKQLIGSASILQTEQKQGLSGPICVHPPICLPRAKPVSCCLHSRHLKSAQFCWLAPHQAAAWNIDAVDKPGKFSIFNSTNNNIKEDGEEWLVNKPWAGWRWGINTLRR